MPFQNKWKPEEIEILRKHKSEMTVEEIQEKFLPHYSLDAIRGAYARYKIKKPNAVSWSSEELTILRKHYPNMGARAMIESGLLERSINAIHTKAIELKLKLTAEARSKANKATGNYLKLQSAEVSEIRNSRLKCHKKRPRAMVQEHTLPIYKCLDEIIDAHFAGHKFEPGTKEYKLGKQFGIINY